MYILLTTITPSGKSRGHCGKSSIYVAAVLGLAKNFRQGDNFDMQQEVSRNHLPPISNNEASVIMVWRYISGAAFSGHFVTPIKIDVHLMVLHAHFFFLFKTTCKTGLRVNLIQNDHLASFRWQNR